MLSRDQPKHRPQKKLAVSTSPGIILPSNRDFLIYGESVVLDLLLPQPLVAKFGTFDGLDVSFRLLSAVNWIPNQLNYSLAPTLAVSSTLNGTGGEVTSFD